MELMFLMFILTLNFFISWHNASVVGRSWADSKAIGGWPYFLTWCAAIMSAAGFTYCYLVPVTYFAYAFNLLPLAYAKGTMELGYIIIILPILGSGLGIWLDSVTTAWRERTISNMGIAAYNSFAQFHNMYSAYKTIPSAFSHVSELMSSDDNNDNAIMMMIAIVIIVLGAGALTTTAIIRSSASKYSENFLNR